MLRPAMRLWSARARLLAFGGQLAAMLLIAMLLGSALMGCSWTRSGRLRFAAGKEGSAAHKLGSALADVFNRRVEGVEVDMVETAERNTLALLHDRKADLAVAFSNTVADGDIRTLAPLYELYLYILVWDDAAVASIPDLRGRKLGLGPAGSGTDSVARHLLEHYELAGEETQIVNGPHRGLSEAFIKRELDAVFVLGSIESRAVERMLRAPGAKLLSLDDPSKIAPAMDGIRTKHPFVVSHVVPKHLFGNKPSEPTGVIGVDSLLVARADLPDDTARELTRAVFAHRVELGGRVSRLRELDEHFDRLALRFPLHPGASQYYRRDEPPAILGWAPTISMFITICVVSWSALLAFAARRRRKRKTLLDELYAEFDAIAHYGGEASGAAGRGGEADELVSHDHLDDAGLDALHRRLLLLRRRAFSALMAGDIEADSAFILFHDYVRCELDEIDRLRRDRGKET